MCRYCSDLYPRTESYRACNWCLKEQEEGSKLLSTEQMTVDRISPASSSSPVAPSGSAGSRLKLTRGAFSPQLLNKPVKKQRLGDRRLQAPPNSGDRGGGEELSPGPGRGRLVVRGKVRRYKLLDEVSS